MKNFVIVVAGGIGKRMNTTMPKQFLRLNEKPIIVHTIEKFLTWNSSVELIVVIHPDYKKEWQEIQNEWLADHVIQTTFGGVNRFGSVKNGLDLVKDNGVVAIHDAARPLVSINTIENCFQGAKEFGNSIPVVPVVESLRRLERSNSRGVNRSEFVLVQTPQCFDIKMLKQAYTQNFSETFTDDASVVESDGVKINLVEGNRENIKITEPSDLRIAESLY